MSCLRDSRFHSAIKIHDCVNAMPQGEKNHLTMYCSTLKTKENKTALTFMWDICLHVEGRPLYQTICNRGMQTEDL